MTDVIIVESAKTDVTVLKNDDTLKKREDKASKKAQQAKDDQFVEARKKLKALEPYNVKEIKQNKVIIDKDNPLGKGSYGAVYRGEILVSGNPKKKTTHVYNSEGPFAVKRQDYTLQMYKEHSFDKIMNEIQIHATVHSNEYILNLHYVSMKRTTGDEVLFRSVSDDQDLIEMDGYVMMVMKKCDMDLQKYCTSYQDLDGCYSYDNLNSEIDRIFFQVCSGHRGLINIRYDRIITNNSTRLFDSIALTLSLLFNIFSSEKTRIQNQDKTLGKLQ